MLCHPGLPSKIIQLARCCRLRTPLSSSQLHRPHDLSITSCRIHNGGKVIHEHITREIVSQEQIAGEIVSQEGKDPSQIEPESTDSHTALRTFKTLKAGTRFWDNKSLLCVQARDDEHLNSSKEKALDFNPAIDAMNAFRIATLIVFGATVLTIGGLSKQWELDCWEDWRIFIQAGHLGKVLIPKDLAQSASQAIPDRLRPNPTPLSEQELIDENKLIGSWHWKKRVDHEWEVERKRREAERVEWEARRKVLGKRIW